MLERSNLSGRTRPLWRVLPAIVVCLFSVTALAFDAETFWREPTDVPFDVTVLEQGQDERIVWQSMVFTSEVCNGVPMRIFAWYARPAAEGSYPAVLSIHGRGGSADLNRAKAFAAAGYACLSYEWDGSRHLMPDLKPGDLPSTRPYTVYGNHDYASTSAQFVLLGPDGKAPMLFHSVIAARRGLSWMSQQPQVDPRQLAVEGHSWGGFTAQIVAGVDARVKATVSSAAAGAWISRYVAKLEGHTKDLSPWEMFQWSQRYDPAAFADRIASPILIRLGTGDFFGSIDTLADYWPSITGAKTLELLPAANHTFGDVETRVAFFDSIFRNGPSFPQVGQVTLTPADHGAWTLSIQPQGPAEITKAAISWTTAAGNWDTRNWAQRPMTREGDTWTITFTPVNAGPLRVFASVLDASGRVASCMPLLRQLPKPAEPILAVTNSSAIGIIHAQTVPTADSGEWPKAPALAPIANASEVIGEQSAALDAQWDNQALYLRLHVDDRTPWLTRVAGTPWFSADSVQLRLRTEERAADTLRDTEMHVIHLGWYPETGKVAVDAVRGANFKGAVSDVSPITAHIEIEPGKGYRLVSRIPWSLIDSTLVPSEGRTIRFALMVNYGDHLTSERIGAIDLNGAGQFNNPNAWGTATLMGK